MNEIDRKTVEQLTLAIAREAFGHDKPNPSHHDFAMKFLIAMKEYEKLKAEVPCEFIAIPDPANPNATLGGGSQIAWCRTHNRRSGECQVVTRD